VGGDGRELPGRPEQKEQAMYTHPVIAAAIADQRHRDLITRADAHRMARTVRTARPSRSRQPRRPVGLGWRAITTATAVLAIVVLALGQARYGHVFAGHLFAGHVFAGHLYSSHSWAQAGHWF